LRWSAAELLVAWTVEAVQLIIQENCPAAAGGGGGGGESNGGGEAGGSGDGGSEAGGSGSGGVGSGGDASSAELSEVERAQIAAELERIRGESSSARGYRQSNHTQLDPETAEKGSGQRIWW